MNKQHSEKTDINSIEERIKRWKAQHGKIMGIETTDDFGNEIELFFAPPDRKTMQAVTKLVKTDEIKAAYVLAENCLLNTDYAEVVKNQRVTLDIAEDLMELLEMRKKKVKKY